MEWSGRRKLDRYSTQRHHHHYHRSIYNFIYTHINNLIPTIKKEASTTSKQISKQTIIVHDDESVLPVSLLVVFHCRDEYTRLCPCFYPASSHVVRQQQQQQQQQPPGRDGSLVRLANHGLIGRSFPKQKDDEDDENE
eukprot:scaffold1923_cov160-Amphora_coffeaeformis.AAC.1